VITAFVLIHAEPGGVARLAEELAEVPGVAEVYSVAGDEDVVAVVRVRHHEELAEVVTTRVQAHPGVMATRTLIAFRAYSRRDLDELWAIGMEGS